MLICFYIFVIQIFIKYYKKFAFSTSSSNLFVTLYNKIEEEAKNWDNHFNDMEKYHEENGFTGHCGGQNNVNGDAENQSMMPGYRGGMMKGISNRSM